MKPIEADMLTLISHMPLIDRLEAVAASGLSRGAVYNAFDTLERDGLAASVPHASELIPSTRRYFPTADGLRRIAADERIPVDDLLRSRPVSAQWRRVLMERLDAVAVMYRLASAISGTEHPIRFRWSRAMPVDAAIALPDGRVIAVVRQGPATDRTGFSKRLWRLRQGERPAAVLMLMPDETRLRHARRLVAGAPAISFLALESDVASAGAGAKVWRTPSGAALLDLRAALEHTGPRGPWPGDETQARASLPGDLKDDAAEDWMLPSLLAPVEKRAIDLLSDWPWMSHAHLGALMGLKRSRLSEVVVRLCGIGLAVDAPIEGRRRLAVTDRALAMLARRDRASVGAGEEALERRAHRRRKAPEVAQRIRQAQQAAAQERRAHGGRSRVHRRAREAGALTLTRDRTARPAAPRVQVLPPQRPNALRTARRFRDAQAGRRRETLLP